MHINELFTALSQRLSIIILTLNSNGIILTVNPFAAKLIGNDIVNRSFGEILVDFHNSFSFDEIKLDTEEPRLLNITTANGLPQTFYFSFFAFENATLAIGEQNSQEIEEFRYSMLAMNGELNTLTRDLQKTNAELIKLNQLKNNFLGIAAHDLRNPISIIQSYSEFIIENKSTTDSEELTEFIRIIHDSSQFMSSLLNNLLDISAIEAGRLDLELCPTNISALITSNANLNRILVHKKNITLDVSIDNAEHMCTIDPTRINQVLNNLISNAIKFSRPGSAITVQLSNNDNESIVCVKDEGAGIPSDEQHKLFKNFSKTTVRSTHGEKNTGLGLAICKKIVEAHNGRIWVNSEIGKGSAFYFSLPGFSIKEKSRQKICSSNQQKNLCSLMLNPQMNLLESLNSWQKK